MSRPKKKQPHYISLTVTRELYEKAQRLASAEHRDVSKVIRRLLAEAPEPTQLSEAV